MSQGEGTNVRPRIKWRFRGVDDAWEEIAPSVNPHFGSAETARLELAIVILAKNGAQDAKSLTEEASKIRLASPRQTLTVAAPSSAFAASSSPRLLADH